MLLFAVDMQDKLIGFSGNCDLVNFYERNLAFDRGPGPQACPLVPDFVAPEIDQSFIGQQESPHLQLFLDVDFADYLRPENLFIFLLVHRDLVTSLGNL
jgi:hypothetical protein